MEDRVGESIIADEAAVALSLVLAGVGLVVLDVRIARVDVLSDPIGFVVALVGVWRLRAATPRTVWSLLVVALAPLGVVAGLAAEAGSVLHGTATGLTATAAVPADAPSWVGVTRATTALLSAVGVLLLARHLRKVLDGIGSDRWRQVTGAWLAFVVLGVLALATGAIELILVAAAAGLIAAPLFVLALLATRRLLEEGPAPSRPGADAFD